MLLSISNGQLFCNETINVTVEILRDISQSRVVLSTFTHARNILTSCNMFTTSH